MEALAGLLELQVGCRVIEHLTNRARLHDVSLGRFHLTPFDLLGQPNDILWCRHFLCRGFLSHDATLSPKPQEVNTGASFVTRGVGKHLPSEQAKRSRISHKFNADLTRMSLLKSNRTGEFVTYSALALHSQ